jgi:hypothetical protein
MPKFSLFTRNVFLHPSLEESIQKNITESTDVTPGQIRKKGDWYYLTYLRVNKVKNFNAHTFEMEDSEFSCTRVVAFQIKNSKLLVNGSKNDIKEITTYFEALAQPLNPGNSPDVKLTDFFRVELPIIDLVKILQLLEELETAQEIKKIRMKRIDVTLGRIDNCIVNTQDYGKVRDLLGEEESGVFGMEVFLKKPEKTSVYFDQDAQIRVITKSQEANVEELAVAFGVKLP